MSKYCRVCGSELVENSMHPNEYICPRCGEFNDECPYCGIPVRQRWNKCPSCGTCVGC